MMSSFSSSPSSSRVLSQLLRTNKTFSRRYFADLSSIRRSPAYSQVTEADVSYFREVLGRDREGDVVTDEFSLERYNEDWLKRFRGHSRVALLPRTTEQVSKILRHCNERRLAVVPQGGNTGLVGGSVPVFDEIVLSLSKMDKVLWFDPVFGAVGCQSGVILQKLSQEVEKKGHIVPLDLGAKGSCHIGGNVATNAGGLRLLRYGSLHGSVLGLEVVLADGTILNSMTAPLRKDNTGYDLKQLFIGSEGTLGVITGVSILCPTKPNSVNVAFFGIRSFEKVTHTFAKAKRDLGEIISAFEFMDRDSLEAVVSQHPERVRDPLSTAFPFYVLLETSGSNQQHDMEKLNSFLEGASNEGLVEDGTVAQDEKQASSIWYLREGIAESLGKMGAVYKYDVSLPLSKMYTLVENMRKRLVGIEAKPFGYGHLGDGNLHLNILAKKFDDQNILPKIEPYVYEFTTKYQGSVSAEHGLGLMKADCIYYSKSEEMVKWMQHLKSLFDPNSILNPYKVMPRSKPNISPLQEDTN